LNQASFLNEGFRTAIFRQFNENFLSNFDEIVPSAMSLSISVKFSGVKPISESFFLLR
jgi:hypothetical protein